MSSSVINTAFCVYFEFFVDFSCEKNLPVSSSKYGRLLLHTLSILRLGNISDLKNSGYLLRICAEFDIHPSSNADYQSFVGDLLYVLFRYTITFLIEFNKLEDYLSSLSFFVLEAPDASRSLILETLAQVFYRKTLNQADDSRVFSAQSIISSIKKLYIAFPRFSLLLPIYSGLSCFPHFRLSVFVQCKLVAQMLEF